MKNVKETLNGFGIVPEYYVVRISEAYRKCSHVEGIKKWCRRLEEIGTERELSTLEAQIRSHCFELEVVDNLCHHKSVNRLVYEPTPIDSHGKNCDLRVCSEVGDYFIEVKSFSPERSSRPLDSAYFPKHATVDLDEATYYDDFSIRRHLIELAVDVEQKFANYEREGRTVLAVPTGFYLDWLRYFGFVHIYKFGRPSVFDYLGEMSTHFIYDRSIRYENCIDEFWSFHYTSDGIGEVSLVEASRCKRQPIRLVL